MTQAAGLGGAGLAKLNVGSDTSSVGCLLSVSHVPDGWQHDADVAGLAGLSASRDRKPSESLG